MTAHARRMHGLTLLELLIAVAIFATVAALAWGGLETLARTHHALDAQSARFGALQRGVGRLERDLRQAAPRPIRDTDDRIRAALLGTADGVELSRYAPAGGWQTASPAIERVAWRCADETLRRSRWPVLDRSGSARVVEEDVIDGVSACRWHWLDSRGRSVDRWPPVGAPPELLPRGAEVTLTLAGIGEIRRVIELPRGGEIDPAAGGRAP